MREWNAPIKVSLGKRHTESLFLSGLACLASGCDLFFSFSNFFDKLARKSLLSRLSRDSLVSFPTDCGGMIENFGIRGAISLIPSIGSWPKPAPRDSKNFWIKRYTHLYKFVADFHARFLVFFIIIICRLIYQFVGLSLFVGRLWFAHRVTYSYLIRSYEDVKGYFRWRLATENQAHEWICTGRRQNRILVSFNVVIVNWN